MCRPRHKWCVGRASSCFAEIIAVERILRVFVLFGVVCLFGCCSFLFVVVVVVVLFCFCFVSLLFFSYFFFFYSFLSFLGGGGGRGGLLFSFVVVV